MFYTDIKGLFYFLFCKNGTFKRIYYCHGNWSGPSNSCCDKSTESSRRDDFNYDFIESYLDKIWRYMYMFQHIYKRFWYVTGFWCRKLGNKSVKIGIHQNKTTSAVVKTRHCVLWVNQCSCRLKGANQNLTLFVRQASYANIHRIVSTTITTNCTEWEERVHAGNTTYTADSHPNSTKQMQFGSRDLKIPPGRDG